MDKIITCTKCQTEHSYLESFPGNVCLKCWAMSPEGRRPVSADELVGMWGGPVRR